MDRRDYIKHASGHLQGIFEDIVFQRENIDSDEKVYDLITEFHCDETIVIDLSTSEQVDLIVNYSDEVDLCNKFTCDREMLLGTIEKESAMILETLVKDAARNLIAEVVKLLDDEEVEWKDMISGNVLSCFAHYGERDINGYEVDGVVYEYRNIENDQVHFDVYEIFLSDGCKLLFQKQIDKSEVSYQENIFDAC